MFAKTALVALFAGLVAGQAKPVGNPSGNPITRPLTEIVPACKPFTITWQPTTPNSVSLVLLRGPSTNVLPLQTIVTGISNSGSFVWTPASSLEADVTRYGLQIIDDITGQYQYSNQFGISKGSECDGYVAPSSSSTVYGGGYPVSTPVASSKASSSKGASSPAPSSKSNATTVVTKTSSIILGTGVPAHNSSAIIQPSLPLSVPSSLIPSATGSPSATRSAPAQSTGEASSLRAGLGLAGAVAAFAFML